MELLAPAGGPEPFRAALAAGADAIYCGVGNDFNARRGARNFGFEDFERACREAHLAGARVYVTINVVVQQDEVGAALALVREAAVRGADAFIVQDWGLFSEIRRLWPELELHVSTQANVHDARGVAWCRGLGAARVTLSRELPLAEIARIHDENPDVDLEVFGHGALCFCYSGVCLLSSLSGGRSANRGLCAQPCRLTYDLVDEDGDVISAPGRTRPLCPKDACAIADLGAMEAAGVGSLKVEGRMKAPDYVWSVVGAYRAQLDDVYAGATEPARRDEGLVARGSWAHDGSDPADVVREHVAPERARILKRAFNRDFTDAYLCGTSGDELMSYGRSNNRGQLVGEVLGSSGAPVQRRDGKGRLHRDPRQDKKSATWRARIRLDEPAGAGDLLELRPVDDPDSFLTATLAQDVPAGGTVEVRVARPMPAGCPVRLIRSRAARDGAAEALAREVPRRRAVDVRVVARIGEPFAVELSCDGARPADAPVTARAEGFVVEPARTRPVTREDLVEHVGRMGSTPFAPRSFDVELDEGAGMGFSAVHKVRARAAELLAQAILEPWAHRAQTLAPLAANAETGRATPTGAASAATSVEVCAIVSSPQAARAALDAGATRLYAASDDLARGSWPAGVVPVLDEVCRQPDHRRLDGYVRAGEPVAVGNVSELALARERCAAPEVRGCIPVHNAQALAALERAGAAGVWLSCELTLAQICVLAPRAQVPVGIVVSGRPRVMTSEHCVLQTAGACVHDCGRCELRARRLALRDRDGKLLPVRTDPEGRSRIYDAFPLDITPQAAELAAAGISRMAVDATLLDSAETSVAVARLARALAAVRGGRRPAARAQGATSGHLFLGIG